jgi:hypothetical protein
MVGRIYTVSFSAVSVGAVQDLIAVYAGTMAFAVHMIELDQVTATAVNNLNITHKRLPATVTAGSGGTSVTPVPLRSTNAAATVTAHCNDTTQATTSGTAAILAAHAVNVINGYLYLPPEADRPVIAPSQAFVLSLNSAPASGSYVMSGTITIEELF